jgi:hypothetical protein
MNAKETADILGVNRRRNGDLREMLRAHTLYPWLNTAEDEKRRVAAVGANALARVPGRIRSAPRGARPRAPRRSGAPSGRPLHLTGDRSRTDHARAHRCRGDASMIRSQYENVYSDRSSAHGV